MSIGRCQALDMNGKRCRRRATRHMKYHGNHELYDSNGPEPTWVQIVLCDKHCERARRSSGGKGEP